MQSTGTRASVSQCTPIYTMGAYFLGRQKIILSLMVFASSSQPKWIVLGTRSRMSSRLTSKKISANREEFSYHKKILVWKQAAHVCFQSYHDWNQVFVLGFLSCKRAIQLASLFQYFDFSLHSREREVRYVPPEVIVQCGNLLAQIFFVLDSIC